MLDNPTPNKPTFHNPTGLMDNKAISMMRGKSPPSDVEMSKKLNFVSAILEFWRPSLIDMLEK